MFSMKTFGKPFKNAYFPTGNKLKIHDFYRPVIFLEKIHIFIENIGKYWKILGSSLDPH